MMSKRKGSRKGSEYDLIDNIISVAEREYGDLEDLTQTQADKVCETVAGITGESVENVKAQLREMDELNGVTRQGSRKGRIINTTEHGSYDVSDIDEYVAQGNIVNPKQIMDYLVNEKGYSELKAWATYDVWDEDRFGSKEQRGGSRKGQDFTAQGIQTVANAFKDITTNKIPNAIGKLTERDGSRKGSTVTFKNVIDYFEDLGETSPKDDDELWDEALNHFGVTTDLNKFDSSEFATYYYGSGVKSTNPIPDDMMVSGRNGSRKGESVNSWFELDTDDPFSVNDTDNVLSYLRNNTHDLQGAIDDLKSNGTSHSVLLNVIQTLGINPDTVRLGQRKGTGPLCDLGSVSGKGSRPENLGSIASKVSLGRNRSINMDGEYIEQ